MVDSSAQKVKEPDEYGRIEYRGKTLPERAEFAMESIISLRDMEPGTQGIITDVLPECALSRRLLDLGFAEGAGIRCLFRSMFGDPTALYFKLKEQYPEMDTLSMGMSQDYKLAVKHGSNTVRIGRAIFE